jgi:hypothetical protein
MPVSGGGGGGGYVATGPAAGPSLFAFSLNHCAPIEVNFMQRAALSHGFAQTNFAKLFL